MTGKGGAAAFGGVATGLLAVAAAGTAANAAMSVIALTVQAIKFAWDATIGQIVSGLDRIDKLGDAAQSIGVTTQRALRAALRGQPHRLLGRGPSTRRSRSSRLIWGIRP